MAGRRHTQEAVAEKMRLQHIQQRLDQMGLGRGTVAHEKMQDLKDGAIPSSPIRHSSGKKNHQAIGHKEFFQVCYNCVSKWVSVIIVNSLVKILN
jgi:hypothetical protein